MGKTSCARTLLAEGDYGRVEQCRCGTVYVQTGPLSVRFTPKAFAGFSLMLDAASSQLAAQQRRAQDELRLLWGELPDTDGTTSLSAEGGKPSSLH